MTIPRLALSLCSDYLTMRTPSTMEADHQLLLVDAITRGIGEYFDRVPTRFRQKSWSARLGGSVAGTVTVTADSTALVSLSVSAVEGASCSIAGDDVINRIGLDADGNYVLDIPYGGATGSRAITVYKDTVALPWTVARFITAPRNAATGALLTEIASGHDNITPIQGYRMEYRPSTSILRLLPKDAASVVLESEIEVAGIAAGGIGSLVTGSALSIPDDHVVRFILPLIAGHLIGHPLWRSQGMVTVAQEKAASAAAGIRLLRDRAGAGWNFIHAPCP